MAGPNSIASIFLDEGGFADWFVYFLTKLRQIIPYNLAYKSPLHYKSPWFISPPPAEGRCPDIFLAYKSPLN
jgi:hypothetical protein